MNMIKSFSASITLAVAAAVTAGYAVLSERNPQESVGARATPLEPSVDVSNAPGGAYELTRWSSQGDSVYSGIPSLQSCFDKAIALTIEVRGNDYLVRNADGICSSQASPGYAVNFSCGIDKNDNGVCRANRIANVKDGVAVKP